MKVGDEPVALAADDLLSALPEKKPLVPEVATGGEAPEGSKNVSLAAAEEVDPTVPTNVTPEEPLADTPVDVWAGPATEVTAAAELNISGIVTTENLPTESMAPSIEQTVVVDVVHDASASGGVAENLAGDGGPAPTGSAAAMVTSLEDNPPLVLDGGAPPSALDEVAREESRPAASAETPEVADVLVDIKVAPIAAPVSVEDPVATAATVDAAEFGDGQPEYEEVAAADASAGPAGAEAPASLVGDDYLAVSSADASAVVDKVPTTLGTEFVAVVVEDTVHAAVEVSYLSLFDVGATGRSSAAAILTLCVNYCLSSRRPRDIPPP